MSQDVRHTPVLLDEAIAALRVQPEGVYVDATFGRGGHSRAILARLGTTGRLIALDRDMAAVEAAQRITDPRFTIVHSAFSAMSRVLEKMGINRVDGMLFDLGVSSPQIEEAARGFSFRQDGPLDMRMDQSRGQTAEEFLATVSEQRLREVIRDYGEERFAKQIARAIVAFRAGGGRLTTTRQLAALVAGAIPKAEPGQDPATRTFQALRIFLNQELEELSLTLPQCVDLLSPGGRLVVISFHSLEDRIVKRFIRAQQQRDRMPPHLPIRAVDLPRPRMVAVGRAIRPSSREVAANPRARSAILRVAERTEAE
ncbi:MAG: 16S rRNA (cytosine(1402)-N(4))-methyltransferase RsmH [Methylophilaceae bacterium]|nr:16S rRNA (cytosine(1402)-N(4))-methyltransferase RsmH [Methylophilaceae bacterium]